MRRSQAPLTEEALVAIVDVLSAWSPMILEGNGVELVQWLVRHCDGTYKKGNWAGRGVLPAIEGVSVPEAHWRPQPEQHTVAELILHMGYWKDAATARLRGESWKYDEAMDWRAVPPTEDGLAEAHAELQRAHDRLITSLQGVEPDRLMESIGKAWWAEDETLRLIDLIAGVAGHDLYHAAQIFVLRRLYSGQQR